MDFSKDDGVLKLLSLIAFDELFILLFQYCLNWSMGIWKTVFLATGYWHFVGTKQDHNHSIF